MERIAVRCQLEPDRVPELRRLYAETWWAADRDEARVARIVAGSDLVFAVIDLDVDRLVGFSRVLTDHSYIALLLDVIVDKYRQGTGLGRLLMSTVMEHPTLASVETVELVCPPSLVGFYSRWGFSDSVGNSRLLRRTSSRLLLANNQGET